MADFKYVLVGGGMAHGSSRSIAFRSTSNVTLRQLLATFDDDRRTNLGTPAH